MLSLPKMISKGIMIMIIIMSLQGLGMDRMEIYHKP